MSTITIQKTEYIKLKQDSKAYKDLASKFIARVFEKSIEDVVGNFRSTGKYSKAFLVDLNDGLKDLRNSKSWK